MLNRLLPVAALTALLSSFSSPTAPQGQADSPAAQYQRARAFANARSFTEAASLFQQAAENEHAEAQTNLGQFFLTGTGVAKNVATAAKWFEKASNQGEPNAEAALGMMYADGLGVKKDEKKAFALLGRAASKGIPMGQFRLGVLYAGGLGTKRDPELAMDWYRKAAEQGFVTAEFALAVAYETGFGGAYLDLDEAAAWYAKAAGHGLDSAKAALQQLTPDIPAAGPSIKVEDPAIAGAKLISSPRPVYPIEARNWPTEGLVRFEALVSKTGRVRRLKLVEGKAPFVEPSMDAVSKWRYQPPMVNGEAAEFTTTLSVSFSFAKRPTTPSALP